MVPLDEPLTISANQPFDLAALNDALTGVAKIDPQRSQIAEVRFFGRPLQPRERRGAGRLHRHRAAAVGGSPDLALSRNDAGGAALEAGMSFTWNQVRDLVDTVLELPQQQRMARASPWLAMACQMGKSSEKWYSFRNRGRA